MFTDAIGTVADDSTDFGALGHLFHHGEWPRPLSPNGALAGIKGNGQRIAGVDGVQADVVAEKVEPGDGIEVIIADHSSHGPDCLVLQ